MSPAAAGEWLPLPLPAGEGGGLWAPELTSRNTPLSSRWGGHTVLFLCADSFSHLSSPFSLRCVLVPLKHSHSHSLLLSKACCGHCPLPPFTAPDCAGKPELLGTVNGAHFIILCSYSSSYPLDRAPKHATGAFPKVSYLHGI